MPTLTFFEWLLLTKGLQPVTARNHVRAIARLTRRLGPLTRPACDRYVAQLYASTASYSHKTNTATAIEHYFAHRGQSVRYARQRKPRPAGVPTLGEAEVGRLLRACRTLRDRALLAVVAYSGCRPKELCGLRVADVDLAGHRLTIRQGKGETGRVVYLSIACCRLLMEYVAARRAEPGVGEESWLFVQTRSRGQYTAHALNRLVKRLGRRAGLTRRVWPYLLRHSLASTMIARGANVLHVRQQLGHHFLDTTYRYVATLGFDPSATFDRLFPGYL